VAHPVGALAFGLAALAFILAVARKGGSRRHHAYAGLRVALAAMLFCPEIFGVLMQRLLSSTQFCADGRRIHHRW
jgi:hypothetical protein